MGAARACLRLMRPVNSAMVGLAVLVGVVIASNGNLGRVPLAGLVSGFLVGFLVSASSMVLNDIIDIEIDKVNAPDRPLPSGELSVRSAKACYVLLLLAGVSLSSLTGLDSLIVALLGAGVAALYNAKLKLSGLPGNVAVAFSTSLPFIYAFTIVDNANASVLVFWAMVFLTVLGREIAKDIADVEGDMVKGARTLPIIVGRRAAAVAAASFYLIAVSLSPLPLILGLAPRPRVYAAGVALVDALLLLSAARLVASPRKRVALEHKRTVLVAMLIGLLTFLATFV